MGEGSDFFRIGRMVQPRISFTCREFFRGCFRSIGSGVHGGDDGLSESPPGGRNRFCRADNDAAGAIVTILAAPSNGWVKVKTASGTEGYCSAEYLSANAASDSSGGSSSAGTVTVAITTANLKLRTGPAVSYTALLTMPQGTKLTVTDNSNSGWAKVKTADGKEGWCSKEFLTITTEAGSSGSSSSAPSSSSSPASSSAASSSVSSSSSSGSPLEPKPDPSDPSAETKTTATTTANLKLRTGPGTNYDMILILASGTELTVTDNSNAGWAKVKTASGKEGWCSKEYLNIVTTGGGSSGSSGGSSGGGSSAPAAPSAYPLPKGQETSKSLGVFNYDMTYAVTLTAQDGADIYYEIAEGKDKAPVPTTKSKKFETYQYGQIEITQPTASADGPVTKTYKRQGDRGEERQNQQCCKLKLRCYQHSAPRA